MEQTLIDYIKQAKSQGTSNEDIVASLREAGWQESQIQEAFSTEPQAPTPSHKKSKNISPRIIVGAIALTFLLIGGGVSAALYTGAWEPAWSPFRPSPQQVIAEMVNENKSIDYFELIASSEIMTQVGDGIEPFVKIETNELVDESNPDLPKMRGSVLVTGKAAEVLFPLSGGAEVQVIFIGRKFYRKISTSWIQLGPLIPLYSLLIPDDPLYSEGPALWFGDPQLYTVEEEFFNERLDGVPVYHYRLDVDPRASFKVDPSLTDPEDLPDSIGAELWIDKQSKRLLRFIMDSQAEGTIVSIDIKFSYPESLEQPIELPPLPEEMTFTMPLHPVENSAQSGTATFSKAGEGTKVSLNLTGTPTGVEQEAYEWGSRCENVGKRVEGGTGGIYSVLNPVVGGISTTDRVGTFEDLLWRFATAQQTPLFQHSIVVYQQNTPDSVSLADFTLVACGDIVVPEGFM